MCELRRYLASSGCRIAAVEESVETSSAIGTLRGRLDVRLVERRGKQAVLDLKWGESSYRDLLEDGRAVQLAAYVRAIHIEDGKQLAAARGLLRAELGEGAHGRRAHGRPARPSTARRSTTTWARVETDRARGASEPA